MPMGSSAPAATGVQVPTWPTSAHERHGPVHATLQHTPSTQKPLAQSSWLVHADAGVECEHEPLKHGPFPLQSAAVSHRDTHETVWGSQVYGLQTMDGP
jgi:hypothetical protein